MLKMHPRIARNWYWRSAVLVGYFATLSDTISDVEDSDAWALTIKTLAEPDGPLTKLGTQVVFVVNLYRLVTFLASIGWQRYFGRTDLCNVILTLSFTFQAKQNDVYGRRAGNSGLWLP
ncbi:hypothetical protein ABVK25_010768 [Lepraria finkii]|uniref:Uncharacterized protein n=1 Tax=Lepraria finkii TaxID=1340010 RepID=A0ABR4ATV4_9LECA